MPRKNPSRGRSRDIPDSELSPVPEGICFQCGVGVAQEAFGGFCSAQCRANRTAGIRGKRPIEYAFNPERNYKAAGTSQAAAGVSAQYAKVSDLHRKIWKYLSARPSTPQEVRDWLHVTLGRTEDNPFKLNTARARMSDLRRPKDKYGQPLPPLIVETGQKKRHKGHQPVAVMRVTTERQRAAWPTPGWERR